jgi:CHASE2 domain-containing sensor protein
MRFLLRPLLAGLAAAGLTISGLLALPDALLTDFLFRFRAPREAPANIALVGITDECLKVLGGWPWSRGVHARMVERLKAAGAKVIVWDMVFDAPGADRAGDAKMAAAIRRAGNVLLPAIDSGTRAVGGGAAAGHGYVEVLDVVKSMPELEEGAAGVGHALLKSDADTILRRMVPEMRAAGRTYPLLPVLAVARAGLAGAAAPPAGTRETDGRGRLRVNYLGEPGVPFETIPYHLVIAPDSPIGPGELDGKIVFVGGTSVGLHDRHATPVGLMWGVELLATATENVMRGTALRELAPLPLAALVVLAALAVAGATRLLGRRNATVVVAGVLALVAQQALYWLGRASLSLPLTALTLSAVASWLLVTEEILSTLLTREAAAEDARRSAEDLLGEVMRDYREQRVNDGLARLATLPPQIGELSVRVRTLRLRGLLLRREERELETWLEREELAELPVPALLEAATDLERRGREDLAEKLLVVLEKLAGKEPALRIPDALARVREALRKGGQASPLLPIARRALGDAFQKITLVGVGGMGFVVRALRLADERWVAVKFLSPAYVHREEYRKRFEREATILARLQHPAIIELFSTAAGDQPHYVMEYFASTGLNERIERQKRLEVREAAAVLGPVARALDHAHRLDIVHRDVKPSNILIGLDGRVKLTDFGIAKAPDLSPMTATGDALGTPDYMSPEQLLSGASAVGKECDVYAFGLVLYEALVGVLPFGRGAPAYSVLQKSVPKPLEKGVTVPADVEDLLMQALATRSANRLPSLAPLAEALERHAASVV